MDFRINSVFPRSLHRFTSFVASTANSSFRRVLSFTGSFNDRTGLIAATVQSSVSSPLQELDHDAPAATVNDAFDIEAAAPALARPDEAEAESKRISKIVGTVSVFAASASLAIFLNFPKPDDDYGHRHPALYSVSLVFVYLSFFTSLFLLIHSIVVRSGKPEVARAQKTAMVTSLFFVLVSFTLRVGAMLPAASKTFAWLFLLLAAGAALLCLILTRKGDGGGTAGAGAGAVDQV